MNVATLLEVAAEALDDRIAIGSLEGGLTYAELLTRARAAAHLLVERGAQRLVSVDVNSEAVPVGLFAAALAGVPYVSVNYRLADAQLVAVLARAAPAIAVVDPSVPARLGDGVPGLELITRDELLGARGDATPAFVDPEEIAILLFTSGTTGEPKAAVLRHRHLASYVLETVEFLGADPSEATLVSVPPYHIAGISAVLTSVWSGRRIVYLPQFDADDWVTTARDEAVTHAMVVPTMLGRILDVLEAREERLPALRHLSYGGGRMPAPVVERAMARLPDVGFVNAYGLTETSSTIAVLTPDDHREAFASTDAPVRARLGSVGRPLPSLELEIRDDDAKQVPVGERGEIWVRGEQVSGEYLGLERKLTDDGWFPTNDAGRLDDAGYLFVEGRLDDVIVRGGENISPGEIEDVLDAHPSVAESAVVGVPDDQWGETVAAAIVLVDGTVATAEELQEWVRTRLRSTRCPSQIEFRTELPYSPTGKLLRRILKTELSATPDAPRNRR
jgi:acyl-CoA synthetase (AMP-forming)/AMP-acid ligase II